MEKVAGLISKDTVRWVSFIAQGRLKCLDVRPRKEFQIRHLYGSVNIPSTSIAGCWFQLPAKQEGFVVLEQDGTYIDDEEGDSCSEQLRQKGWKIEGSIRANTEFWQWIEQKGLIEQGESKRLLFEPSPHFKETIPVIEESLSKSEARALDIGCGSGRDLAWLCSRESKIRYKVTGVDAEKRAIYRFSSLFETLGYEDRIEHRQIAKMDPVGKWKCYNIEGKRDTNIPELSTLDLVKLFGTFSVTESSLQDEKYDLVVQIRFLHRLLLTQTDQLLCDNGFLFLCTFVNDGIHDYEYPKGQEHRLELGEAAQLVRSSSPSMKILKEEIGFIEDGRPVQVLLAQKQVNAP
ncbi:methyltransferase with rhodanese domain [Schizosaccharomyces osmophilus]|uniref:Methyltransferase with rhodanese domain n=1 Tax=Schizosaccharomyces osmophilus TaxID=2545709 RepID=A0AAE9W6T8_9SCHI|nr:methyltransferase with rhodanese domain [Schizosaccharomyces osmophilus]WBW70555.1 methyltransferase with rhodanese domain [Schizosaccharomyces osmophilus]